MSKSSSNCLNRVAVLAFMIAGFVFPQKTFSQTDTPNAVVQRLASAFAQKDTASIKQLVNDPWSGLRFCSNWTDDAWQATSAQLRHAKMKSRTKLKAIYEVTVQSPDSKSKGTREIFLVNQGDGWKLDLNSFLGPFPEFE